MKGHSLVGVTFACSRPVSFSTFFPINYYFCSFWSCGRGVVGCAGVCTVMFRDGETVSVTEFFFIAFLTLTQTLLTLLLVECKCVPSPRFRLHGLFSAFRTSHTSLHIISCRCNNLETAANQVIQKKKKRRVVDLQTTFCSVPACALCDTAHLSHFSCRALRCGCAFLLGWRNV